LRYSQPLSLPAPFRDYDAMRLFSAVPVSHQGGGSAPGRQMGVAPGGWQAGHPPPQVGVAFRKHRAVDGHAFCLCWDPEQ
jgi:hypothetical protein